MGRLVREFRDLQQVMFDVEDCQVSIFFLSCGVFFCWAWFYLTSVLVPPTLVLVLIRTTNICAWTPNVRVFPLGFFPLVLISFPLCNWNRHFLFPLLIGLIRNRIHCFKALLCFYAICFTS